MAIHPFWGNVKADWAGFSSDRSFSHPFFNQPEAQIFLGEEFDEEGEEMEEAQILHQLDSFADTYQNFTVNLATRLVDLQQSAFDWFQQVYAHYYTNPDQSGKVPFIIDSVEKHNPYLKDLMYLRVLEDRVIKVTIRYQLDPEHGIEFKFVNGQVQEVGGIAET